MSPLQAAIWIWLAWILSWMAAAFWANRTEVNAPLLAQLPYRAITAVGVFFLFVPRLGGPRLWAPPPPVAWGLVVLTALGFAICWWARLHLGRLWSGTVTRKSGHRIVDTGPYALVRHPIYTGLIVAAAAAVGIKGTAGAIVGGVLIAVGCWIKARLEERFLSAELGEAAYADYRRRTGMLFPGL